MAAAIHADRCGSFRRTSVQAASVAGSSPGAIVGDWLGAGYLAGMCLGAAFGLVVSIAGVVASHVEPVVGIFAALGVLEGAIAGIVAGVALGLTNGLVLACLCTLGLLGGTEVSRRRRVTLSVGITSAVLSLALFDFGFAADGPRWLWVYVPTAVATLAAVVLSRTLEPIRPRARLDGEP
jgi:hypothetical protein